MLQLTSHFNDSIVIIFEYHSLTRAVHWGQSISMTRNNKHHLTSDIRAIWFLITFHQSQASVRLHIIWEGGFKEIIIWRPVTVTNLKEHCPFKKLLVAHVIKNFPTFYSIRKLITLLSRIHHRSLSPARWMQSKSLGAFFQYFVYAYVFLVL